MMRFDDSSKYLWGLWVGIAAVLVDLALWVLISALGQGALPWLAGLGADDLLANVWNWFHAPVNVLAVPYLVEHVPSHGGGLARTASILLYLVLCLAQAFIAAFIIATISRFIWRLHTRS